MKPGDLVKLHDVSVSLHSDWCWQLEDGCHEVGAMRPKEVGLCLAVVTCGYPSKSSKQALVLLPNGRFGWQSVTYFKEVT